MTTWLKDDNGNKCSVEYFGSREAAQEALDSLVDCRDCSDCSDCRDCRDCSDCRDCRGCRGCLGCRGCSDCSDCRGCSDCRFCSGCRDCSDCPQKDNPLKIPTIENIHQKVYEAASQPDALDMSDWHTCDTTHCRAGWVVFLAGDEGRALEKRLDTPLAASLIYRESSKLPVAWALRFYETNEVAMADMKRMAELEAKKD